MFCTKCGKELEPNIKKCTYCAGSVDKKRIKYMLIAFGIVGICLLILLVKNSLAKSESYKIPLESIDSVFKEQDTEFLYAAYPMDYFTEECSDDLQNKTEELMDMLKDISIDVYRKERVVDDNEKQYVFDTMSNYWDGSIPKTQIEQIYSLILNIDISSKEFDSEIRECVCSTYVFKLGKSWFLADMELIDNVYWFANTFYIPTKDSENIGGAFEGSTEEVVDEVEEKQDELITEEKEIIDKEIFIENKLLHIMVGESIDLEVQFVPEDTTNKFLNWKSSDSEVVSVDQNGTIYGINKGEATISAVSNSGNSVEITIQVKERYYTVDNLPDGIFIKKEDLFYPLLLGMPEGYNNSRVDYFWTEASNYEPSDFATLQKGDVIAYKGPIEGRNIGCILVKQIPLYGYVLNVFTGSRVEAFYDFDGDEFCDGVRYVDDIEVDSMYELSVLAEWTYGYTNNSNFGLIFGDFKKDEKHTLGFFEGTTYCEKEVIANKWGASYYDGYEIQEWFKNLKFNTTRDGYFETTLDVPESGLYVLKFKESSQSFTSHYEWDTLVWVEN